LRYNARKYWNRVKFGIEKQQEAIRIIRQARRLRAEELLPPPGSPPFAYRAAYEAAGWRPIAPWETSHRYGRWHRYGWGEGRFRPKDETECQSPRGGRKRSEKVFGLEGPWRHVTPANRTDLADYATALRHLEQRDLRRLRRDKDSIWREGSPNQLSHAEWEAGNYRVEVPRLFLDDDDLLLLRRVLAKSPGRSPGRPPIGDRAMTDAERQCRCRAKAKWKPASAVSPQTNSLALRSRSGRQLF
jgi:hypothetical protein